MMCTLCNLEVGTKNIAVFECGHTFHLSCVFNQKFKTSCSICEHDVSLLPDLGGDREIAIGADVEARVRRRQLQPSSNLSYGEKVLRLISPLTPIATTFTDHLNHNKRLMVIHNYGFSPSDAVQERIPWSKIYSRYSSTDILEFGFRWDHMAAMNVIPAQITSFTWSQQQHILQLDAAKLLAIRMTITELANMKYTTHQLVDMGFDWSVLARLGANVDTWKQFKFSIQDIKRNWSPTLSQWVAAGFYDKERVEKADWTLSDVLNTLPAMTERCAGRVLRLAF